MASVPVTSVTLCRNCESVVGKETKVDLSEEAVKIKLETDSDNFIKFKNRFGQDEYRMFSYKSRCVQC